jgi:hypothetical protein
MVGNWRVLFVAESGSLLVVFHKNWVKTFDFRFNFSFVVQSETLHLLSEFLWNGEPSV